MSKYQFYLASSLEKVFPMSKVNALRVGSRLSTLKGSAASVQLVYYAAADADIKEDGPFHVAISGAPAEVELSTVGLIPSELPSYAYARSDDDYLTHAPGLFPDLLVPVLDACITPIQGQYRSLWMSFHVPPDAKAGDCAITITVVSQNKPEKSTQLRFILHVAKAARPVQTIIHTQWLHTDCLSSHYGAPVFSDAYWRITENFIAAAARHHINMILTPVFTPPLDTQVGGERPTVQLVQVSLDKGVYTFGFENLTRWLALLKRYGIAYVEIPHFFTQWGALCTPKIMVHSDGIEKRLFGWDVPAKSEDYRAFLEAFVPALKLHLENEGFDEKHVYFHISDEPSIEHIDHYRVAKEQVRDLIGHSPLIDALSNPTFYESGLVENPIPSVDHFQAFKDLPIKQPWVYYCCGQSVRVPNRFFAMPSRRSRIMGVLFYLYGISGFLQWGFNFYYSCLSKHPIDPYRVSDAGCAFPSGDAYLVYPGQNGTAYHSVRAMVLDDAFEDLAVLKKLESLKGRAFTEAMIRETAGMWDITFVDYPRDDSFLLHLREKAIGAINSAL